MKLSEFNYNLPRNMIAQKPASPRDSSKLMLVNYQSGKLSNHIFNELSDFLEKGDVLVFNNTKVFPARLFGKKETGGKVEVFLLTHHQKSIWEVLISGKRMKIGMKVIFSKDLECTLQEKTNSGVWKVKFNCSGKKLDNLIDQYGQIPIPPYIKSSTSKSRLKKEYQTVYAKNRGSVAAPTAGLHFTNRLMTRLKKQGVVFKYVTLHVGLGTFEPVKEDEIEDHQIHSEFGILDQATAKYLNKAQKDSRRIIIVGTTTMRVIEAFANQKGILKTNQKWIDIFIYPGYQFKFAKNLMTNFHLPKSTLLMLISALAGKSLVKKAYQKAIKDKYRFFSFGDVMLINNFKK
jgi:S-adenosylmethionine:tRNA ribosyltransferase-isomerase